MRPLLLACAAMLGIACGGASEETNAPPIDASTGDTSAPDGYVDIDGMLFPVDETGDAIVPDPETDPLDDVGPTPDSGLTDYPLPPIPAGCTRKASIVTYNPNGWSHLLDAFEAEPTPCGDYYLHLPAIASDKTKPRAGAPVAAVRARKGRFFAVAEFHYGAWAATTGMTWFEKGVEFRKRMEAAGYNLARGDTWAINELPSSVRTGAATRTGVRDLVRGLYTGPAGAPTRDGIVFVVGMGQPTTNFSVYKPNLEAWTIDSAFWNDMNKYVKLWGQEAYADPHDVCVPGSTVAAKSDRINAFVEHPARLAFTGPTTTAAARTFFNASYFATMTAFWKSTGGYGATDVSLTDMEHLVSLQVYAVRAWAEAHPYPDGRLGFAWDNNVAGATPADLDTLALRLAQSIRYAYGLTTASSAAKACSPTGAYTWCACSIVGATFNDGWNTFATW